MGELLKRNLPKLDVEDCSYFIRELERNAFSQVVTAMRAQGVLTDSKELILERLKDILFIPEEIFKGEIRRATNDQFLSQVAKILNPHYDTFTQWGMVSREVEEDVVILPPVRYFKSGRATTSSTSVADSLLMQANKFNEKIENKDIITMNLLSFPNVPFVPEKMRKLFRDTEGLASQRLPPRDEEKEEPLEEITLAKVVKRERIPIAPKPPTAKVAAPPAKRKRKPRANATPYVEPPLSLITTEKPSTSTVPPIGSPPTAAATTPAPALLLPSPTRQEPTSDNLKTLLPTKAEVEALGVKEFINKIQAQIEQEQRNGLFNDTGKRKRKPRLSSTIEPLNFDCARARPFERRFFGPKPYKPKSERLTMKRHAPGAGSPIMVPPVTPPHLVNGGGFQSHSVPVQVIPPAALTPSYTDKNVISSHLPSTSSFDPHLPPNLKENTIRPPGSLPLSYAIAKPTVPTTVPAVAGQTQMIKRPRLASYSDPKLPTSPVDLSKATAMRKAAYLPVPNNKVKLAVTPPVEVHGQAASISKPTIYGHPMAVTVNRSQNRVIPPMNPQPAIIQRPSQPPELHGHDYSAQKSTVIKKAIITNAPPAVRAMNGSVQKHFQHGGIVPILPQTIVREQVIVKKVNPTTPATTPTAPPATSPLVTIHKPSPPPNTAMNPIQSSAVKKYMMTGVLPTTPQTQNHTTSLPQYMKVTKAASPASQIPLDGATNVKRIYYSETATTTNIQNPENLTEREKLILRATAERERALRMPIEIRDDRPSSSSQAVPKLIDSPVVNVVLKPPAVIHRVITTDSPSRISPSIQIISNPPPKSTPPPPQAVDQPPPTSKDPEPRPEIIMEIT